MTEDQSIPVPDRELLIRIDERTTNMVATIEGMKINYVHKDEFKPVRSIVYGMVAVILLAVVGALVALVVRGGV